MKRTILVTGGMGYIGSHTVAELVGVERDVLIVDNLANSSPLVLDRIAAITGVRPRFHQTDVRDAAGLDEIFRTNAIEAVVHFAGLKAVGESVAVPLTYYDNNVSGTICLVETMARHGIHTLVFSSSATVYGDQAEVPIKESAPLAPTNPYGRSKFMVEQMLRDVAASNEAWRIALLRYFNPVGAHESGVIGEDPMGIPNNLMPLITQVALGRREKLFVYGNDYPTHDGTGIRDYIHVTDLAHGHIAALRALEARPGVLTVNLGTGNGFSVLEMITSFEAASGVRIPYQIVARRPGDVAVSYADPSFAHEVLGWRATLGLDRICQDAWNWQRKNPKGYEALAADV